MEHEPRQAEEAREAVSPEQAGGAEVPPVDGTAPYEPEAAAVPQPGADGVDGTDGTDGAAPEQAAEPDLAELQAKAAQRDEFLALAQRTQADFENFRRRASREQAVAEQRGLARVVKE